MGFNLALKGLNSALAAAKMWLLKGCTLKVKKILGLSRHY
jgi:hypothetical protein